MSLPVLLAVDDDRDALDGVETQLVQRYSHEYRIESLGDPEDALRTLQELADGGEDVALVLASSSLSSTSGGHLLEHVRRLHPQAGRVLLVPAYFWTDEPTSDAIRDAMALGSIDYYAPRPAGPSTRCSTRRSRGSCSSGRGFGASFRRRCTSWARPGPGAPTRCGRSSSNAPRRTPSAWRGRRWDASCIADGGPRREASADGASGRPGPERPDRRRDRRASSVLRPGSRSATTTSSSWAPGPRASRQPSTAPRRGCASSSWTKRGIGGQARSSSLIRNYLGFAMGVSGSRLADAGVPAGGPSFGASFLFMHRVTALARSGDRLQPVARGRAARQRDER